MPSSSDWPSPAPEGLLTDRQRGVLTDLVSLTWPANGSCPDGVELGVVDAVEAHLRTVADDEAELWRTNLDAVAPVSPLAEAPDPLAAGDEHWTEDFHRLVRRFLFADPGDRGTNPGAATWAFLGHPGIELGPRSAPSVSSVPSSASARPPSTLADVADEVEALVADRAEAHRPLVEALRRSTVPTEVDAVVVGVGASGAIALRELGRSGATVLGLEAGPLLPATDFVPNEGRYAHYAEGAWSTKFQRERPTWRAGAGGPERPARYGLGRMVNAVGGSLLHYGSWLRRWHPHHFGMRSYRQAVDASPDDGFDYLDHTVDYPALEPHYDEIERLIGVSGDGSNPFTPRSSPLPMPPLRPFEAGRSFTSAAAQLGLHPYPIPVGMNSRPYGGRPATGYLAWDNTLGSLDRARWSPLDNIIPEAVAMPNVTVATGVEVTRIVADGPDGSISGVEVDVGGEARRIACRRVVLAAYTFEVVRLLYLSADRRRPDGLGNSADLLGRHVMPKAGGIVVTGHFPGRSWGRAGGPAAQAVAIDDFIADRRIGGRAAAPVGFSLQLENQALPIQIGNESLPPGLRPHGSAWQEYLRSWDGRLHVGVSTEFPPVAANRLRLSDRAPPDRFGRPRISVTCDWSPAERRSASIGAGVGEEILQRMGAEWTHRREVFGLVLTSHDLGGARMAVDDRLGVVGPDHQVFDTPNLFVVGGSVLVSSPPLNPTLTILAETLRSMRALAQGQRPVPPPGPRAQR